MVDEVGGDRSQPVRIAEDGGHLGGGFFAGFDLVVAGSLFGTLGIVVFNFCEFLVIEDDSGGAAFVDDGDGDFVLDGFGHGVGIDDRAEDIEGGINGGSGEADIGGVGEPIMEIFGKTIAPLYPLFGDAGFLIEVDLAAVGFVGNADDVVAIAQHLGIFSKFMNRGEKYAAAAAIFKEFSQLGAAFDADHGLIPDIGFGVGELAGELIVEIGAIGD